MSPDILTGTRLFMEASGQSIATTPAFPDADTRTLRRSLLCEELGEYITAEAHDDLVEVVDGLLDIIVVAHGTLLSYIGPEAAEAAAAEVTRSNLDKIVDGVVLRRKDGKVRKPPEWRGPDIAGVLQQHGGAL
jgi:predicted HAD superfamily Cof-like phosphohydrolase